MAPVTAGRGPAMLGVVLMSACVGDPPPWPYGVGSEPGSFGEVARCLFELAQVQLRDDVLLSAGSFRVEPDGVLRGVMVPRDGGCPVAEKVTVIDVASMDQPGMWGRCRVLDSGVTDYEASCIDLGYDALTVPITEWTEDTTDLVIPPGSGAYAYLLPPLSIERRWDIPEDYLDGVPDGRALFAFTDEEGRALSHVIDGVTGELLFLGAAAERD